MGRSLKFWPVMAVSGLTFCGAASATALPEDLTELSLEALLDIEVTSVSKQPESLATAAASVYVLSAQDIHQSGARSIPEALRLVPGLHVARINGQQWAITAHGFNASTADKLEVLIDGRSIYNPLFSGVFWDAQDIFMPDIDRIEVIRGPSSALWGSNAVNGVINIVTRHSSETQGLLLDAGGGTEQKAFLGVRQGGTLGSSATWRGYAKYWQRDAQKMASGADAQDGIDMAQTGFRLDWQPSAGNQYVLSGAGYSNQLEKPAAGLNPEGKDDNQNGANMRGRWSHVIADDSEVSVQLYWDHTERTQHGSLGEIRDTWDAEFKHRFHWGARHSIVWGAGYRASKDEQANPPLVVFTPASRTVKSSNVFVSDQYAFSEDTHLTLSTRLEDNEFTGLDHQPSIKLSHQFGDRAFVWGGVSRALRLPNRLDNDVLIPLPEVGARGNKDFVPEELISNELGVRFALTRDFSIDLSTFYNKYDKLRGVEPSTTDIPQIVNNYKGTSYGADLAAKWEVSSSLTFDAAYSFFELDLEPKGDTADIKTEVTERNAPRNQYWLRWNWQPSARYFVAGQLRHVDEIRGLDVPAFNDMSLRLGWNVTEAVQLSITGENLLESQHREWGTDSEVERGVYAEIIWRPGSAK